MEDTNSTALCEIPIRIARIKEQIALPRRTGSRGNKFNGCIQISSACMGQSFEFLVIGYLVKTGFKRQLKNILTQGLLIQIQSSIYRAHFRPTRFVRQSIYSMLLRRLIDLSLLMLAKERDRVGRWSQSVYSD